MGCFYMEWFNGDIEKYKYHYQTTFKLVTIAKAFHWIDHKFLIVYTNMISVGRGIAIIVYIRLLD